MAVLKFGENSVDFFWTVELMSSALTFDAGVENYSVLSFEQEVDKPVAPVEVLEIELWHEVLVCLL